MHKGRLYVVLQYKREQISSYFVLSQEEHIQSFLKKSDYWPWRKHSHCIWTQQKMQDSQDLKKQYLYIYIYIYQFLSLWIFTSRRKYCVCVWNQDYFRAETTSYWFSPTYNQNHISRKWQHSSVELNLDCLQVGVDLQMCCLSVSSHAGPTGFHKFDICPN